MSEMTPREIVSELDQHIIGQKEAKRAVAIALRNRWRRMQLQEPLRHEVTPKNILMIGPTGVGKTEIARRLAKLANAPFIKVEATKFTEVGYVGKEVDSIIRDLMYDINSPSESTELINLLMRWSSGYNLHIHTVLHLNKGDDNTRGHIGTELNNKAETVLQITKSTQDGNISEVKAMHIRDREFDPFAFRINDSALPEVVEGYVFQQPKQDRSFSLTELTEKQHREALENGFGKRVVQGYSNVIQALKQGYASIGYERGRNVLVSLNKFLVNKRMIVKEGKGYRYNPDFHY